VRLKMMWSNSSMPTMAPAASIKLGGDVDIAR
jgi:hypothetical protein